MNTDYEDVPMQPGLSAYETWARALDPADRIDGKTTEFLQPVLVRLRLDKLSLREALLRIEDGIKKALVLMDSWELEELQRILAGDDLKQGAAEATAGVEEGLLNLYWREAADKEVLGAFAEVFEIVSLGRRIVAPTSLPAIEVPRREPLPEAMRDKPFVAVIDDGIGFLNARFRRRVVTSGGQVRYPTRFHAVWLQSYTTVPIPPFYGLKGRVLYRGEIDAILDAGPRLEEGDVYRALDAPLAEQGAHRSLEFSFTHGTHVTDIAAGADPETGDPVSDWPLMAVQLPPQAVNNTAGQQLEPCIRKGVRWILAEARALGGSAPVIINISFATFAGPKDGTKRIEARIARMLKQFETQTGRCARVVYAFGNDWRSNQLARFDVTCAAQGVELVVQPDNRASTLVEIRTDHHVDMARLAIDMRLPDGTALPYTPLPQGVMRIFFGPAGPIARLFHAPPEVTAPGITTPAYFLLAIAPTADRAGPRAPAGAWRLDLRSLDTKEFPARIEVQRGDTPIGYPLHGRQSYLEHPDAHEWEAVMQDYSLPGPACPINRKGTHSSFVTAPSTATLCVGAAEVRMVAAATVSSRYSAEGSSWTIKGPDLSALADMGPGLRGCVAAGTYTGSARTLDGTSVAAAQVSRSLATDMAASGCTPTGSPAAKKAAILALVAAHGTAAPPAEASRIGAGVITHPDGGRQRR